MSKSNYRDYFIELHPDGRMVKIPVPQNKDQLGVLQGSVGGYIEHIQCPGGRMSDGNTLNRFLVVVNEDGRRKKLPINSFAKLVVAAGYRVKKEDIVSPLGTVVIVCCDDSHGWYGGVHESVEELLLSCGCRWKEEPTELTLQISISLEHDTLAGDDYQKELERLLEDICSRVPSRPAETNGDLLIHDTNGNLVGTAAIKKVPIKK